jgi:hypothetical protein
MRFWEGECSRAFTDWRGLQFGVEDGAWLMEDRGLNVSNESLIST